MKIIALYSGQYPEGFSPMSRRLHYYMKALSNCDIETEVVVLTSENKPDGIFEGIKFSYVKIPERTRYNGWLIDYSILSRCSDLAKKCDVLFIEGMSYRCRRKIPQIVHKYGGKVVEEVNENPGTIKGSCLDTALFLKFKRYFYLHHILPLYDGFIVISHPLEELIKQYKADKAVVVRIPILSCSNAVTPPHQPIPKNGIPYILHAGALSEQKDGIIAMLQAFAIAHKHFNGKLKFYFTYKQGFPKLLHQIDEIIKKNNLGNDVQFLGILPNKELEKYRANSAMAIVNKPSNSQNNYNFPTKLSEILPARIPLIVTRTGEMALYFKDNVNAFVVDANNVNQIAEKIIYILEHPKEVERITAKGQELANKEFYYKNFGEQLSCFFHDVMK